MTRSDIVSKICEVLREINQEDGYSSNIGDRVFILSPHLPREQLPVIVVRDTQNTHERITANTVQHVLSVSIDIVASGKESLQEIRGMISDIYRAFSQHPLLDGNAEDVRMVSDSIEVEQKEYLVAGASVEIEVVYTTGCWED